jgi:hypothetical protein
VEFLKKLGFLLLNIDYSVFYKKGVIIAIYINDLLIIKRNCKEINLFKEALNKWF